MLTDYEINEKNLQYLKVFMLVVPLLSSGSTNVLANKS